LVFIGFTLVVTLSTRAGTSLPFPPVLAAFLSQYLFTTICGPNQQ